MRYLLGLDMGTTSVKCVLFNQNGKCVGLGKSNYNLDIPKPDYVEVKTGIYWDTLKEAITKVLVNTKINVKDISGIGISSQGETFVPIDINGNPLRKAIVWLDNRSKEEAKIISREFGEEEVYRITGQNKVIPTWTATKILWLKRNEPNTFERVFKYLLLEDYILFRLTGKYVTEHSIVCSSLLYDISHKKWWNEILDFLKISESQLPELYPSGTAIANITNKASKETGLHKNSIVSTGAYDQAANALGVGNIDQGIASETTGGALAVVATTDRIIIDSLRRVPCHCHALKNKYFIQPWCPTAGVLLKWYKDNFGLAEIEAAKNMNVDPFDLLTFEAQSIPAGSEGLVLLPHFEGAASPEFNPNAKGVLFGLKLRHGRSHIIRAILESVAYMVRRNLDLLTELGVNIKELRLTGGGAKSSLWNQIKADVLQKPLLTLQNEETGALGAAILAGLACNIFNSIEEASKSMVSIKEKMIPNGDNRLIYDKMYEIYIKLYSNLENIFKL
jgi:xylulokinase